MLIIARRAIASEALTQPFGRFSKICFSTAFERAEETVKEGLYEAKHQGPSDPARERPMKATKMAETVGDTAKPSMDGAWKASRETTEHIKGPAAPGKDRHHDHEYDPVQGPIDDLRNRAGGYDLNEK